ncbi:hypothetical protein Sango_1794100 [Sesamum angolense]|uniref:Uncharacterized protein n=1 Tax=Sesamum angolense TaxID=2727404 RepID=A0AAE1WH23_9LAMI|nr:hypothetical protein Sango_1794100 [Sesamum angolense]
MVKSCIAMARATNAHNCQPSLTPFEALPALHISKVKGMKSALVDMSLCVDVNKVLCLEKGFFGNCMVYNRVLGDGIQENELSKAGGVIKEAFTKTNADSCSAIFEENSSPHRVSYYIQPAVGAGRIIILPSPGGDGRAVEWSQSHFQKLKMD